MTREEFKKIIDICSNQEEVRNAVKKNHNNQNQKRNEIN